MSDKVSICICTYRRNELLGRLLRKVAVQETDGLFELAVIVVDNDDAGHARETVAQLRRELGLSIAYDIEPERTIPAARNHALRLADGNFIAIIDDDEFPPTDWLITMYRAVLTFDTDGALGPVHPFFDETPPDWLIRGRFCERPVHRTGTLLNWDQTRTGNVFLKKEVFDRHGLSFDPNFKTGGSDREFFRQAMRLGCRFVAVEEAPVYEVVPRERWEKSYWLRRAVVNGYNSQKYIASNGYLSRLAGILKSVVMVIVYAVTVVFASAAGPHAVMKYAEKGAHHLSRLAAAGGIQLIRERKF